MTRNRRLCGGNGMALVCLAVAVQGFLAFPTRAQATGSVGLDRRMDEFISAFDSGSAESFVRFFPTHGDFTYEHTVHGDGGGVRVWRFPATQAGAALDGIDGLLWPSFTVQWEGQPIGLFAHQVLERPGTWVRVRGHRYVPPGGDAESRIYVEWRREGTAWVISRFGDEFFNEPAPLPSWCCYAPG